MRAVKTPYAQTEFVVAVMDGDAKQAECLLECMTPMQRYELEKTLTQCGHYLFLRRQAEK